MAVKVERPSRASGVKTNLPNSNRQPNSQTFRQSISQTMNNWREKSRRDWESDLSFQLVG
jgi:hypothetical protein